MRKLALLFLCMVSTVHANPYMEAVKLHSEVYKYINRVAPTLYILNACQSDLYVPTFNYSLEQTYKLAIANDDRSRSIVETIWATHEYSIGPRLENSLILITQGLRNEETRSEVIEACNVLTTTVRNRFHWMYHVMDTRSYK
jgi:hypothetical protein